MDAILDRVAALERGLRRVENDRADDRDALQKRFGKVWAALKGPRNDDQPEEIHQDTPSNGVGPVSPQEYAAIMRRKRGR